MSIRIVMIDDHPMILKGLKNTLSDYKHINIIGCYANGKELLNGLEENTPDVLLLDIQLPGKTGDELLPLIVKRFPQVRVLALTNFDSTLYINNMVRLGVHGYLLKTADEDILIKAIETVYEGKEFIDPSLREKMQDIKKKELYSKVNLTLREKEILKLIINGSTSQEIVNKLFLSINTVNNYRTRIFQKLDAKNMAELIKKALMLGLEE